MISSKIVRNLFYTTARTAKKHHSDCREIQSYYEAQKVHEDCEYMLRLFVWRLKFQFFSGVCTIAYLGYYIWKSMMLREKFEIKYLTQTPIKDYEANDYDYKYWELIKTKPGQGSPILNTDQATKDHYVLLYHGKTSGSHLAMQRFARLKKYISLRKEIPLKSVFVAMDKEIDPEFLDEYAEQYSTDIEAVYPNNKEVRKGIKKVFQNLGCIYVLERSTGNVIYIVDPNKHPLEAMGTRLLYTISKNIDFRVAKEIVDKNINIKSGHDEELRPKLPRY